MPSQPVVRALSSRVLLAALATGLLALSSAGAAAAASEAAPAAASPAPGAAQATSAHSGGAGAADGVVITWRSAERRFEPAEPEHAAALVRELQQMLASDLAERLHLASDATPVVHRTESGLLQARIPARLVNLSVVRVAEDGAFAGACTQGPAGALDSLSQAPARPEEE